MTTTCTYHYEERQRDGEWISCGFCYRWTREQCLAAMHARKANNKRGVLRMIKHIESRYTWRECAQMFPNEYRNAKPTDAIARSTKARP